MDIFDGEGLFKWQGVPFKWTKPPSAEIYKNYRNHRWFKFWECANQDSRHEKIRDHLALYICNQWNSKYSSPMRLLTYKIWYHYERNYLGKPSEYKGKQMLWDAQCGISIDPPPSQTQDED